jgi:tetratricopeptide (TPR) repeat protein
LQAVRRERLKEIISENFARFPIYVCSGTKQESGIEKSYLFLPNDLFFRLLEKETNRDRLGIELEKKPEFFLRGVNDKTIFKDRVASEIIGNYSLIFNDRGNLWQGIDVDRAIIEYKNALKINPSYSSSQLNLGFAYINKKDYDRAMEVFIRIFKEAPTYNPSLVHYGFGLVYQNKSMIKEAIKEYSAALEIDPNNTYAKQSLQKISP